MSNTSRSRPARGGRAIDKAAPGRDEVSALEAHLGYWLRFVSNHVSHAFKVKVEALGVTVAEWVILRALFGEEAIKPGELAASVGLTRGAISKLLDRLRAKGLVVVRGDTVDRRAQRVTLSASGRRLVPKLAALADENDAEAFGFLSAEQRATLLSTLEQVVDRLGLRVPPVE